MGIVNRFHVRKLQLILKAFRFHNFIPFSSDSHKSATSESINLSYSVPSCPNLSCPVLSRSILSCDVLYCFVLVCRYRYQRKKERMDNGDDEEDELISEYTPSELSDILNQVSLVYHCKHISVSVLSYVDYISMHRIKITVRCLLSCKILSDSILLH